MCIDKADIDVLFCSYPMNKEERMEGGVRKTYDVIIVGGGLPASQQVSIPPGQDSIASSSRTVFWEAR